jgi:hypothetical protein
MNSEQAQRRGWLPAALSLAAIGFATLTPRPDQAETVALTPPWCLLCGELGGVDVLLNLLLFGPLGIALRLAGAGLGRVAAASLGTSLMVELLQLAVPGRDPSLSDLVTNTVGAVAGGILAAGGPYLLRPARPLGGLLALGWAWVWLVQTGLTAVIVTPSLPQDWYWGQLAAELPQFEQFTGQVAAAAAGPYPIRIVRLRRTAQVRAALLAGQPLVAMTTPGGPTPGLAPIVSIFDEHQREIVLLGRWGNDLVYRLRTVAFDVRLRPPAIRLPGAFEGLDSALVGVSGRYVPDAHTWLISLSGGGRTVERQVALNPQWGWMLLLPFPYAQGAESEWLTAFWIAGWMLPLGYWSAAWGRIGLGGAGAVAGIGLGAVPWLVGFQVAAPLAWLAAAAGLAMGAVAARRWKAPGGPQPPSARSAASP